MSWEQVPDIDSKEHAGTNGDGVRVSKWAQAQRRCGGTQAFKLRTENWVHPAGATTAERDSGLREGQYRLVLSFQRNLDPERLAWGVATQVVL